MEMFILGSIGGLLIGLIVMALIFKNTTEIQLQESLETQIKLRQKRDEIISQLEADLQKYKKIKNIIRIAEITDEFAVFTVNNIKEVINDRKINQ